MSKRLPYNVKQMLNKARESALLAVEVYNKTATKFKSGGYVVLMSIGLLRRSHTRPQQHEQYLVAPIWIIRHV